MSHYVDVQYATMLASRYQQFKVKHRNPLKINFRCPVCGDSKKSRTKSRAWIVEIPKTGHLHFNCFNCDASQSFTSFAKMMDPSLYNDYIADRYLEKVKNPTETIDEKVKSPEKITFNKNPMKGVRKVSQLSPDHPVKKYIEKRKIPSNQHYRMYFVPKFMAWINTIIPNKFKTIIKDEPRLVIPLVDKSGKVNGVSARSFNSKTLRYITIMFDDVPKMFGLDTVDFSKPYFVVEGCIDSLFLTNSCAMVGADINLVGLEHIENAVFIHDAEPRNKEICDRMERHLKEGRKVCIWPPNVPGKDINEMHINGLKNIEEIINQNTYKGLTGLLKMKEWRKC